MNLKFKQIAAAGCGTYTMVLYGLSVEGDVYEYKVGYGWVKMSDKEWRADEDEVR